MADQIFILFSQLHFGLCVVARVNKEHLVKGVKVQLSQRGPTGMAAPRLFVSSTVQNSNRKHFSASSHKNGSSEKGRLSFFDSCTTAKQMITGSFA